VRKLLSGVDCRKYRGKMRRRGFQWFDLVIRQADGGVLHGKIK